MDPTVYESLRNRTLLFFVEKLVELDDTKISRTLHDLSCQFGSKGFTKEMRQIAGGSQSGLKKFLSEYPSLFSIQENLVSYRETSTKTPKTPETSVAAVDYFRERLIQYGMGVWVPVKSLLGHRSQAPTPIRHVCGQHLSEFLAFLSSHPETFKVKEDSVILVEFERENCEENCGPSDKKENVLQLIKFYGNVLKERGPMLVEQLFHVSGGNEFEGFRSPTDLKSFFQMHGECFQVTSSLVTLSDSFDVGLSYLQNSPKPQSTPSAPTSISISINRPPPLLTPTTPTSIPPPKSNLKTLVSSILLKTLESNHTPSKKPPTSQSLHPQMTEEELKNYLTSRTQIVSNVRKAREIVASLQGKVVVLDLEGVNLGDENGQITCLQICCGGDVFLFDVLTQSGLMYELKPLLEGPSLKVLHDCRNDSSSLFKEHGILLKNVYDTQMAHLVLFEANGKKNIESLNGLATTYGLPVNLFKDRVKSLYRCDPRYWSRRPLTPQMIAYASADVVVLEKVYEKIPTFTPQQAEYFQELVQEQILACISPEEIRQRRKMRKNERDLEMLKEKIESSFSRGEVVVLSNRELRLLKHLTLPEAIKESLKSSLKIAKKLEKLEKRENFEDNSSSDGVDMASLESTENNGPSGDILWVERTIDVEEITTHRSASTQTHSTGDIVTLRVFEM